MTQYGVEVMYLSDLVRKFALKQGNTKSVYFLRNLEFARWAWKELFRRTIWEIKTEVLCVSRDHTITVPDDCERLINISVIDKFGIIKPLSYNPNINTAQIRCQKSACSCKKCNGENTLCGALDNITKTTEIVEIQGAEYTLTTWIRYDKGVLQKQQEIPTLYQATNTVVMTTQVTTICNIETDINGCIRPTAPNIEAFRVNCGFAFNNNWDGVNCTWFNNAYRELIPASYNFFGQWNWNAASRDIIHMFHSGRRNATFVNQPEQCGHEENDIKRVIVTFQTNGESANEEILIPQYAEMAVNTGMLYQQRLFNPKDGDRDESGLRNWRRAVKNVDRHLNPIRLDDMIKLQTQPHYW